MPWFLNSDRPYRILFELVTSQVHIELQLMATRLADLTRLIHTYRANWRGG